MKPAERSIHGGRRVHLEVIAPVCQRGAEDRRGVEIEHLLQVLVAPQDGPLLALGQDRVDLVLREDLRRLDGGVLPHADRGQHARWRRVRVDRPPAGPRDRREMLPDRLVESVIHALHELELRHRVEGAVLGGIGIGKTVVVLVFETAVGDPNLVGIDPVGNRVGDLLRAHLLAGILLLEFLRLAGRGDQHQYLVEHRLVHRRLARLVRRDDRVQVDEAREIRHLDIERLPRPQRQAQELHPGPGIHERVDAGRGRGLPRCRRPLGRLPACLVEQVAHRPFSGRRGAAVLLRQRVLVQHGERHGESRSRDRFRPQIVPHVGRNPRVQAGLEAEVHDHRREQRDDQQHHQERHAALVVKPHHRLPPREEGAPAGACGVVGVVSPVCVAGAAP